MRFGLRERISVTALVASVTALVAVLVLVGPGLRRRALDHARDRLTAEAHYVEVIRHPELGRIVEEVLQNGQPRTAAVRLPRLGGDYEVSAAPFPGLEGEPHGAVATFEDVSDRRRADEIRRDFAANASHELRTPLTSIRGLVEALEDGGALDDPETAHRFLAEDPRERRPHGRPHLRPARALPSRRGRAALHGSSASRRGSRRRGHGRARRRGRGQADRAAPRDRGRDRGNGSRSPSAHPREPGRQRAQIHAGGRSARAAAAALQGRHGCPWKTAGRRGRRADDARGCRRSAHGVRPRSAASSRHGGVLTLARRRAPLTARRAASDPRCRSSVGDRSSPRRSSSCRSSLSRRRRTNGPRFRLP